MKVTTLKECERKTKMKTIKRYLVILLALSTIFCVFSMFTINATQTIEREDVVSEGKSSPFVDDELQPMVASNCGDLPTNLILLGWTEHGTQSAYTHNGHGVSNAAILQAMTTTPVWNARNQSWNYYGSDAVVCLNTSGYVTTCWATNSNGYRY